MVDVKNDMEHLVRQEVKRRRAGRDAGGCCWCPLCEADVVAFALNHLPPRYCRTGNFGYAASQGFGNRVADAVRLAIEKVGQRPKHRPGAPDRFRTEALLEDFGLKIGAAIVDGSLAAANSGCACDGCRADALAFALNRYPPKYGVSTPGRTSYQANFEDFIRHELGQTLTKACRIVSAHPNH
jgi:competence protein ComFB